MMTALLVAIVMAGRGQDVLNWTSVELGSPGTLGYEVLYKVNSLAEVEYLRVKGPMNDDDFATLKNMANLKGADFSEAAFEAVPNEQFNGLRDFHLILLPKNLKSIGHGAFGETAIESIDLPPTLTFIGDYSFESTAIESIDLPLSLTFIGYRAFYNCDQLRSVVIPSGITTLEEEAFYSCDSLNSVVLPSALKIIGAKCFWGSAIKNIEFPAGLSAIYESAFFENRFLEDVELPAGLTFLGHDAFSYCSSLKRVVLPYSPNIYQGTCFYDTSVERVVCPAATPPAVEDYFWGNLDFSKATLVVPSFAVVDYKLDNIWHQFGTIVDGVEPSVLMVGSTLQLTNNRRPTGKVDIELLENAQLIVDGNAPLEVGTLTFTTNINRIAYGQLLNSAPDMRVDRQSTRFYLDAGQWFFITPYHDVNIKDVVHSDQQASFIFRYYNAQNRAANGPSGSWQDILGTTLKAGQGYIVQTDRNGWLTLPSVANSEPFLMPSDDVTTALSAYGSANDADANWNYVGNPYPCFYDTYYMELAAPITVWDYSNNTYRAYSPIDDNYVLRPMEAFFVQKPSSLKQILFRKEGRQTSVDVQRTEAARQTVPSTRRLFDIAVTNGEQSDVARLVVSAQASLAYETGSDVVKFFSSEATVPQLYTLDADSHPLAINERPDADGSVRLGVRANKAGTYTFSMQRGQGTLLLTDAMTGQTTDLSRSSYTFAIDETGDIEQRFTLAWQTEATSISDINAAVATPGQLYDLQGRRVATPETRGIYVKDRKIVVVK